MISRPLFSSAHAGSPHPADETGEMLDLTQYLVRHPSDTFFVRVTGHSMAESGIFDGDILIVDRAVHPQPSDVVVAETEDGYYTVKHYRSEQGCLRLVPSNPAYPSIDITERTRVCGVVRFTVHKL